MRVIHGLQCGDHQGPLPTTYVDLRCPIAPCAPRSPSHSDNSHQCDAILLYVTQSRRRASATGVHSSRAIVYDEAGSSHSSISGYCRHTARRVFAFATRHHEACAGNEDASRPLSISPSSVHLVRTVMYCQDRPGREPCCRVLQWYDRVMHNLRTIFGGQRSISSFLSTDLTLSRDRPVCYLTSVTESFLCR